MLSVVAVVVGALAVVVPGRGADPLAVAFDLPPGGPLDAAAVDLSTSVAAPTDGSERRGDPPAFRVDP